MHREHSSDSSLPSKAEILAEVTRLGSLQPWNHNFELPHGVQTAPQIQYSHGKNLVKWDRIEPILQQLDLAGKTVLDVGCNEGYFSCKLAQIGARVRGIDVDTRRIEKAQYVKTLLNANEVDFSVTDIYAPEFSSLGAFDVCLCMGFLHRVPDPFRAMARLAERAEIVLFEWKALKFGPHDDAFAYFSPKPIDTSDYYGTEYWLLSFTAVERMARRVGFKHFWRLDDPTQRRAILLAGKSDAEVFRQTDIRAHRGRVPALLSHTKRYLRTLARIITGQVNA